MRKALSGSIRLARYAGIRHASIQTTLNIYTHVVDSSHRTAIEAVERELFPSVTKSADQLADGVPVSDSVN
jgi:hypothetical protein